MSASPLPMIAMFVIGALVVAALVFIGQAIFRNRD
jgi:hypothetical protein